MPGTMPSSTSCRTKVPSKRLTGVVTPISVAAMPPMAMSPTMPQAYMTFSMVPDCSFSR